LSSLPTPELAARVPHQMQRLRVSNGALKVRGLGSSEHLMVFC
jgi:hypothetical protein